MAENVRRLRKKPEGGTLGKEGFKGKEKEEGKEKKLQKESDERVRVRVTVKIGKYD